jgi:hypothetical protein
VRRQFLRPTGLPKITVGDQCNARAVKKLHAPTLDFRDFDQANDGKHNADCAISERDRLGKLSAKYDSAPV